MSAFARSYQRYIGKGVTRLETLLEVIIAPEDTPEELVDTYVRLFSDRSFVSAACIEYHSSSADASCFSLNSLTSKRSWISGRVTVL